MNSLVLAVDVTNMVVYDYLHANETPADLLKRSEQDKSKDITTWEHNCNQYPDNLTFKGYLEKAKQKSYRVMTYEEYHAAERAFYIEQPLEEVTAERFYEMLNVLPPRCWITLKGVEMFCMSEMLTGTYTDQYAKAGDKYYTKIVDAKDRSTWIHECLTQKSATAA